MVLEVLLAAVGIGFVIFALARNRDEEPPVPLEGGGSHLRERKQGGD